MIVGKRAAFDAPLSLLTHDALRTRPASSWLALGEPGRVIFLANTPHANWRHAAVQAVHELVEAALHHHHGVTQDALDAADLAALATSARDASHDFAATFEVALAQRLGLSLAEHALVVRGQLAPPIIFRHELADAP